jgi:general secretion pathway protein E
VEPLKTRDATEETGAGAVDIARLASEFGLDHVAEVTPEMLDSSLVAHLPVEWARDHCLLPVRIDGALCVLTCDPSRVNDQENLALLLGEELRPVVASRDAIMSGIEKCYYSRQESAEEFLRDLDAPDMQTTGIRQRSDDLLQIAENAPTSQLVNVILLEALKARASDVHVEPFESRLRIRYRIDGTLYEQALPPKHIEQSLVSRLKVMAHMDIAEKRLPQDGMAKVRVGEREIDIRVSTVPVAEGERVVLRLLDRSSALLPLQELGMPAGVLEEFRRLLKQTNGLILVTGPTGSGKTTTLYAALGELDSNGLNIMTIEDPIEYQLTGIGQIQVKPKIGLTFADGLRHILRQDPDVILVGETRDEETAETAARSSLTGHLVFTTLHTNDAASAIVRMTDMGVEPYLLAASLRGALAQRLLRRLCPACRKRGEPDKKELERLGNAADSLKDCGVWTATGCAQCLGGYKGRVGVYELLVADGELQEYVREGACSIRDVRRIAGKQGAGTLLSDGLDKVRNGVTTMAELIRVLGSSET